MKLLRSLQPNFLFRLVIQLFVFEFEHQFIGNPMVITEPAVPSAHLYIRYRALQEEELLANKGNMSMLLITVIRPQSLPSAVFPRIG